MAKVQIKIALAIDSEGNWGASGWGNLKECAKDEAMAVALECLDEWPDTDARYWIILEKEVPEIETKTIGADQVVIEVERRAIEGRN